MQQKEVSHLKPEPMKSKQFVRFLNPNLCLANDGFNGAWCTEPEPPLQNGLSGAREQHDRCGVNESQSGKDREDYKPEPKEDVDLFVEDVQSEDAQRVVLLYRTSRTELMEGTLGHPRKNGDHRIRPVLLVHVRERNHICTVLQKSTSKELVGHENVDDHVDEVEGFAGKVPESVRVVHVHCFDEVLYKARLTVRALLFGPDEGASHAIGDHSHQALLPVLPDPVGDVEEDALRKIFGLKWVSEEFYV